MRTYPDGDIRRRILIIAFILLGWFFVVFLRLIELQVVEHGRLKAEALEQNQDKIVIQPKRGTLFDRNGKILARSVPVQSVFLTPMKKEPPAEALNKVNRLSRLLDLSDKETARIEKRVRDKAGFIWVKRKIDDALADKVKALGLKGVFLQEENERVYPLGRLAAHILGGVDIDGKGQAGVEFHYNETLRGREGEQIILRDARRREYQIEVLKEAKPGKDLYLTIDETIQYIAEQELERAVAEHGAAWGTIIVSRPLTGEILAMANRPAYDPRDFGMDPEAESNRAIRHLFEPGSTFKIISAAAALESGRIRLSDVFDCSAGSVAVGRTFIHDHKLLGFLSFPEVLIDSSNVGMVSVAGRTGENDLYQTIKRFRIGEPTGIDLPGEEKGLIRPLRAWNKVFSLPHIAIGYEVSVTALQVLQAMNVYAAGGLLVQPRITGPDAPAGEVPVIPAASAPRVISERTASVLSGIFRRVVEEGTGTEARLVSFAAAGKTGTAQKHDVQANGYSALRHVASFVGFVPAEGPEISMIVVIDEPKGILQYGGQVAAPVFKAVAGRVLRYLRLPPQRTAAELPAAKSKGVDAP